MDFGVTIIGAGVVGLAVAAELANRFGPALLIEKHGKFGQETSSHNSEVLHAGLYYPRGSYKERLCLEGNEILQDLARRRDLPVRMLGKLVVGDHTEEAALEAIFANATGRGVKGLSRLTTRQLRALEPNVSSTHGFLSSNTGILDSHALMHLYLRDAEAAGACCVYHSQVTGVTRISGGYRLEVVGPDGERSEVDSERVVNAAGLFADRVAALAGIDIDQAGYRLKRCRGDYFSTRPRCWKLVSRLIYPVPVAHTVGLGIHVTLDLAGRLRLGPDTTWIEDDGPLRYAADPGKRAAFLQAVQRYLPGLSAEDLEPEFAGIRPKLQGPGEPTRDFVICEESARGLPGFVNLIGIESPGLTASPAIAREVRRQLEV